MSWAAPEKWTEEAVEARAEKARVRRRRHAAKSGGRRANWRAPFLGCDGEGYGADRQGKQILALLRLGNDELYFGGERLSSEDCLEFILGAPKWANLVGYYFNYDATMILRDLPHERLSRLMSGELGYTYWKSYAIDWRPWQYLRVARIGGDGKIEAGSARAIYEVSGHFRSSFLEACAKRDIGGVDERELIAEGKRGRPAFATVGAAERAYCAMECKLLAKLMEQFREACIETGLVPASWAGPGRIAALLHKRHGTPRDEDLQAMRSDRFMKMADAAFYAGRFEAIQIGRVRGPIYAADLNSTYAAVMPHLPCPKHTTWSLTRAPLQKLLDDPTALFCADVGFRHNARGDRLAHLPIRTRAHLVWPQAGSGVYWSPELRAAIAAGTRITDHGDIRLAKKQCDCKPFEWVEGIYDARVALGSDTIGYPLKIALAALYGKFVQRSGAHPYRDIVAAGLITSIVRGWLTNAYAQQQPAVVMLASDAIYSTELLDLPYGTKLGQWSLEERPDLFVVQPGLYWSSGMAPKTKGIPRSAVIERFREFEAAWDSWLTSDCPPKAPMIPITTEQFIGFAMAKGLGGYRHAARWRPQLNRISFSWASKRTRKRYDVDAGHVHTYPIGGSPNLRSEPFNAMELTEFRRRQIEDEAAPDFVPWGNQGE